MIGAEQTGTLAGLRVGENVTPTDRFPVARLAHITYVELRRHGYAHLDEEQEFCRWFAIGMRLATMMADVPTLSMSPASIC